MRPGNITGNSPTFAEYLPLAIHARHAAVFISLFYIAGEYQREQVVESEIPTQTSAFGTRVRVAERRRLTGVS